MIIILTSWWISSQGKNSVNFTRNLSHSPRYEFCQLYSQFVTFTKVRILSTLLAICHIHQGTNSVNFTRNLSHSPRYEFCQLYSQFVTFTKVRILSTLHEICHIHQGKNSVNFTRNLSHSPRYEFCQLYSQCHIHQGTNSVNFTRNLSQSPRYKFCQLYIAICHIHQGTNSVNFTRNLSHSPRYKFCQLYMKFVIFTKVQILSTLLAICHIHQGTNSVNLTIFKVKILKFLLTICCFSFLDSLLVSFSCFCNLAICTNGSMKQNNTIIQLLNIFKTITSWEINICINGCCLENKAVVTGYYY